MRVFFLFFFLVQLNLVLSCNGDVCSWVFFSKVLFWACICVKVLCYKVHFWHFTKGEENCC